MMDKTLLLNNEQGRIKGSIAAVWSLAVITVLLRFSSRRLSKAGLWYDDWLLIPAIVCFAHYPNPLNFLLSNHVISSLPRLCVIRQVSGVLQPFFPLYTGILRLNLCLSDKSWPRKKFVYCLNEWYKIFPARSIHLRALLDIRHLHCQVLNSGILLAPFRPCSEG